MSHDAGNGEYDCDGTQTGLSNISKYGLLTVGEMYNVGFEIKNYVSGSARMSCGSNGPGDYKSINGFFTENLITITNQTFYITADADFIGSVDNLSVKPYIFKNSTPYRITSINSTTGDCTLDLDTSGLENTVTSGDAYKHRKVSLFNLN